jgi:hypothetical protein
VRRPTSAILLSSAFSFCIGCDEPSAARGEDASAGEDASDGGGAGGKADDSAEMSTCIERGSEPGFAPGLCEIVIDPSSALEVRGDDGTWSGLAGRKFCSGTAVPTPSGWALLTAAHCDPAAVLGTAAMPLPFLRGFAPASDDGMFWADVAVRCADGSVYKIDESHPVIAGEPAAMATRWESCSGEDVALLHMETEHAWGATNPQLFGVLDEGLREGTVVMGMNANSIGCASLFGGWVCDFDYAALHYRDELVCPSGYAAGTSTVVNWQGIGVNSTHGDSGSGLVDLDAEGSAPLAGVIVATADYVPDLLQLVGIGDGWVPCPDQTMVVPGDVVHACFPAYHDAWSR